MSDYVFQILLYVDDSLRRLAHNEKIQYENGEWNYYSPFIFMSGTNY